MPSNWRLKKRSLLGSSKDARKTMKRNLLKSRSISRVKLSHSILVYTYRTSSRRNLVRQSSTHKNSTRVKSTPTITVWAQSRLVVRSPRCRVKHLSPRTMYQFWLLPRFSHFRHRLCRVSIRVRLARVILMDLRSHLLGIWKSSRQGSGSRALNCQRKSTQLRSQHPRSTR